MYSMHPALATDRKRKASENASFSKKISTKDNLRLRWLERLASAHLPSANFIFEITFPDVDSMRFEAIARSIHYAEDTTDFMECFVVRNVMPFFSNILYNGDILLRVNGQSLLRKSVNGEFIDPQKSSSCFENISTAAQASLASTPPSGVTIRFMRSGSTSLNFTPSPAELNLFQVDKHIAAKLIVVKAAQPAAASASANANGVNTSTAGSARSQQQQWSIQLSYLDPQLPSSISQMMLGGSVTWDHTLLLSRSDSTALAQCTQASMLVSGSGTSVTSAGPGAFYAPSGAPAGLGDSWVAPAASLYSSHPQGSGHSNNILPQQQDPTFVMVATAVGSLMSSAASTDAVIDTKTSATPTLTDDCSSLQASGRVYLLDATTLSSGITGTSGSVNIGGATVGAALGYSIASGAGGLHASSSYAGNMSQAGGLGSAGNTSKLNKEAGRWVAVLEVTGADNSPVDGLNCQQFNLGRFDREQDARLALDQAVKEVQETKQFRPKHFLARLSAAYTAAATAAYQQQVQVAQQNATASSTKTTTAGFTQPGSQNKFLSMQAARVSASGNSSSNANMSALLAQANNVVCVGETSCGFGSVAKVVLAPGGVHTSSSSGNISALNAAQAHPLKK